MDDNSRTLLTKARAGLILDQPFFGSIAIRHKLVEDATIETCAINGKEIKYNPSFINGLSLDQVKGLLAHEVLHVALLHHTRKNGRDNSLWNEACDYAINILLKEAGFYLPDHGLVNYDYRDWSAEQIYAELQQQKQQQPDDGDGDDGDGDGDKQQDKKWGDVEPATNDKGEPATAAELSQAEQDAKVMVQQATLEAKMQGRMDGGIGRAVDKTVKPKINWRDVLRQFINQHAKNDYSWNVPNRRFIHQGLYLPSLHSEEIGDIVFAVDTSGSIDLDALNQMCSEISDALSLLSSSKLTVIYCDSSVKAVDEYTEQDLPIHPNPVGGGGTDFCPVFDHIKENNINPVCLIYLTDMHGNFPVQAPSYPVLWGVVDARYYNGTPPFGVKLTVKE